MADERVVSVKLEQIEGYHDELRMKQQELSREDLLTDTTEQRAVERMFENVIQACSDLAQHIATRDFGYTDQTSSGAIRVLCQEDVIDSQTMQTLVAAVGFRNVLAHEYGHIDYVKTYDNLQTGLDVYDHFSQQVARWFQTTQ
jgi:uncharacterized protein YutE (UPF0331/DUF86 family)